MIGAWKFLRRMPYGAIMRIIRMASLVSARAAVLQRGPGLTGNRIDQVEHGRDDYRIDPAAAGALHEAGRSAGTAFASAAGMYNI